jgi:hypothetical protein
MSSPGTGRFWLASPATALVLGCLVLTLALVAAGWPLASLARLSVNASTIGTPWWALAPFGVVGFVMAWRKPGGVSRPRRRDLAAPGRGGA